MAHRRAARGSSSQGPFSFCCDRDKFWLVLIIIKKKIMTTREKMNDLLGALDKLRDNFNLSDLERIISLAKEIEREIERMEKEMETFKKAA